MSASADAHVDTLLYLLLQASILLFSKFNFSPITTCLTIGKFGRVLVKMQIAIKLVYVLSSIPLSVLWCMRIHHPSNLMRGSMVAWWRGGRIGRAWASHVGDWEFSSWSSQTNDLQNLYLSFPSQALSIIRIGQGLVGPVSG